MPGVRRAGGGPADGPLRGRQAPASLPPLVFGAGVLLAPPAARPALRRGADRVVPLLLPAGRGARCGRSAATAWRWTGSRSGRATTGATTWARSRGGRLAGAARLHHGCPSARSASRACTRERLRAGGLRGPSPRVLEGMYAGPPASPAPGAPRPAVVFAGRHIPEKQVPALVARDRRGPRPRARAPLRRSTATAPTAAQVQEAIERAGLAGTCGRPGLRGRRRGGARDGGARSAWCSPPAARATGWWWSRRRRGARRAWWWRVRTTPRWS